MTTVRSVKNIKHKMQKNAEQCCRFAEKCPMCKVPCAMCNLENIAHVGSYRNLKNLVELDLVNCAKLVYSTLKYLPLKNIHTRKTFTT